LKKLTDINRKRLREENFEKLLNLKFPEYEIE
jgi:hypothetical protein